MSISKSITEIRSAAQADFEKEKAKYELTHRIVDSLPPETPPLIRVSPHGYCADGGVQFEGDTDAVLKLMELYPPLECITLVDGSQSQKPVKYLRKEEMRGYIRPIYPLVLKRTSLDTTARWWTTLNGFDLEMSVSGKDFEISKLVPKAYYADSHTYSTGSTMFFPRLLAIPTTEKTPFCQWMHDWTDFGNRLGLAGGQKVSWANFAKEVLSEQGSGRVLDFKTYLLYNPYLQYFKERGVIDKQSGLIDKLAEYAEKASQTLPANYKELDENAFAKIEQWFADFFSTHGRISDQASEVKSRIVHMAKNATGITFYDKFFNCRGNSVSIRIAFQDSGEFRDFTFSVDDSRETVKPQDLDVIYQ